MLSEVTSRFVLFLNQRVPQDRPTKYVNPHRGKITSRIRRFFLKFCNLILFICNYDSEPAGLLHRNRHGSDGYIRLILLVKIQHLLIIHLVNMIAGKNQNIIRIITLHKLHVLINRVRRSRIPFAIRTFLVRRQDCNTSHIAVQVPWNSDSNMGI